MTCPGYVSFKATIAGCTAFSFCLWTILFLTLIFIQGRVSCETSSLRSTSILMSVRSASLLTFFFLFFAMSIIAAINYTNASSANFLLTSPNNTVYQCESPGYSRRSAFPVLFSSNSTNFNGTCKFTPARYFCDSIRIGHSPPPWVNVNGTDGAFLCDSSSLEGLDACSSVSAKSQSGSAVMFILILVCILLMPWTFIWVSLDGNIKDYLKGCFPCCFHSPYCRKCSYCYEKYESVDAAL